MRLAWHRGATVLPLWQQGRGHTVGDDKTACRIAAGCASPICCLRDVRPSADAGRRPRYGIGRTLLERQFHLARHVATQSAVAHRNRGSFSFRRTLPKAIAAVTKRASNVAVDRNCVVGRWLRLRRRRGQQRHGEEEGGARHGAA